jgi:ABC-type transport system involved in multi-copper enzyme maturation permease subunit
MLLGPIFSVDMVTMARRMRYFVLRGLYSLAMLFALWMVYINSPAAQPGVTDLAVAANLTADFFSAFSFVQLVAVLMLGPAMVAGTIATERERRTIEYLFTAQLSNIELILSKLAARMLQMGALLLTGLPILALAMMLGGIAPEALFVVYAITGSTIVVVAAISMAVSVWCKRAREAVATAYLVLLALLVVPMVLAVAIRINPTYNTFYNAWVWPINGQFLAGNPLWVLGTARLQASGTGTGDAWQMVFVLLRNQLLLAAVAVVWASVAVRRVHLRQSGKAEKRRRRFQLFRPSIAQRPMLWKELFAARTTSRLGMIGRIAVMLLVLCVVVPALFQFLLTIESPNNWEKDSFLGQLTFSATAIACGMLLLLAARAAAAITSEKERETWDSLLATPLESGEIVNAKLLGNLYSVRGGFWVLALLWALGIPFEPSFLVAAGFTLAVFFIMAVFVTMVGINFSLGARSSIWAMGCTLGTCLFVGGGYLFCCMPLMIAGGGSSGEEIMLAPCIPFLLAIPTVACVLEGEMPGEIIGPFVIGIVCYAMAAGVLYLVARETFDRRSGRTGVAWIPPAPPPGWPPPVPAELVGEADGER